MCRENTHTSKKSHKKQYYKEQKKYKANYKILQRTTSLESVKLESKIANGCRQNYDY